jgi:hypothetical protein
MTLISESPEMNEGRTRVSKEENYRVGARAARPSAGVLSRRSRWLGSKRTERRGGKMSTVKFASYLSLCFLLAGCHPLSLQSAFNPNSYPPLQLGSASGNQPYGVYPGSTQSATAGSRRADYIWEKALQGMAMGGSFAGLYGAGGGLVLGLLTGLLTANAREAQLDNQLQTEQAKDKELEAKVEEELDRQRKLENLLGSSVASNAAEPSRVPSPQPALEQVKNTNTPANEKSPPVALAALEKKEIGVSSPSAPFKNVEVKDINGDGIPDLWIYYNPLMPGEIVRQEESTHWDGKVDSWSYFKDGKLVRREVDTKNRGAADTVYYYDNDQMVREERDERAVGYATFRVLYQNGRRVKLEEDSSGAGKIDHWIYYDTSADSELVLKEERDLNGDGAVDLWSYYQNGRLVRQDVSAVGVELLSKQDRLPVSSPDSEKVALPADKNGRGRTAAPNSSRLTVR